MRLLFTTVLVIALVFASSSSAEPLDFKQDGPKAQQIVFKPEAGLGEMVGRVEGVVDKAGKRFFLSKLNVMSPLVIQVLAKDESKPVSVSLHRFFWTEKDRDGVTNDEGLWGFAGRVHDEVGIEIRAVDPSGFYILAWQGAAIPQVFGANVFVPMESTEPSRSWTMYLIVGVLILLSLAVAYLLIKTKNNKVAAGAILILALAPFQSRGADTSFAARIGALEADLLDLNATHTAMVDDLREQIAVLDGQVGNLQFDTLGLRNEVDANRGRLDVTADKVTSLTERFDELNRQFEQLDTTTNSRIDGVESEMRSKDRRHGRRISDIFARVQALETLHEADDDAVPDPSHSGTSPMPFSCGDADGCWECFAGANERLRVRLQNFERLRVFYDAQSAYMDQVVTYGDARSGWHQLEQARWFEVKKDIVSQKFHLISVYKGKYEEFSIDLIEILELFNQCQLDYGIDNNWLSTHGLLFYESFRAIYRRP